MSTYMFLWGLPRWLSGKESTCNAGDLGLIPGSERSWGGGNDNPIQYSCLGNPMDRGAWRATVLGFTKSGTQLNNWTTMFLCAFFFFYTNSHFRRALFYSYHLLIIEIYWMLFLFDVINLKGNNPVTCSIDPFLPGYWKLKPCLVFGEMNMYIPGPSKKVHKAKNLSIGFCPNHWGLQSQEIWWLEFELASLKPHAHSSSQVPTWKMWYFLVCLFF